MRLFNKNIFLALALLAAAQGCDKEPVTPQDTGAPIMLSAAESGTKALLNNGTFNTNGNRIQIYDYVDGTKYFVDQIGPDVQGNTYGYDGVWPFVAGPHQWTPGTHKFFGWLAEDANMVSTADAAANTPNEFFGTGFVFDETNKVLTIPSKEMTASTPQFDFLYSNIVSTEPQQEPVGLTFSHLFSAVSFGIINDSKSPVTLYEYTVTLYNSMSATINFSGDTPTPVVTYSKSQTGTFRSYTANAGYSIAGQTRLPNAFKADDNAREYILLWPHSESDLNNCSITVRFKLEQNDYTEEESLSLPVSNLEAGNKYHFDVSFVDKGAVKINYLVVDWKTIENEVTFE